MGGTTFENYIEIPNLNDAFNTAVDQARYDRGNGGYTGTIAEKSFSAPVRILGQPLTQKAAEQLAYKLIDGDDPRIADKWGPAGAIPVCAGGAREVTVEITAPFLIDHTTLAKWRPLAEAKARLKPNEEITEVRAVGNLKPEDVKFRVSHRATEGKAVTRYVQQGQAWAQGAPTQAMARADAVRRLSDAGGWFFGNGANAVINVEAVVRRQDGSPLVVAERTVTQSKATIAITITTKAEPGAPVIGWLFFGWASC